MSREERQRYIISLYRSLKLTPHLPMPDKAINNILGHFRRWDYAIEGLGTNQIRILRRSLPAVPISINLSAAQTARRNIEITDQYLVIRVDEVIAEDIIRLLQIEDVITKQFEDPDDARDERAASKTLNPHLVALYGGFSSAKNEFSEKGAHLFTDREIAIIRALSYASSAKEAYEAIDASLSTISRVLSPLKQRLGAQKNQDINIDLVIMALSLGLVNIDHVQAGQTESLNDKDKELLVATYPVMRLKYPSELDSSVNNISRWSRMYDKLGVEGRIGVVLCAIKDGLIELPARDEVVSFLSEALSSSSEQQSV